MPGRTWNSGCLVSGRSPTSRITRHWDRPVTSQAGPQFDPAISRNSPVTIPIDIETYSQLTSRLLTRKLEPTKMNLRNRILMGIVLGSLCAQSVRADERRFTYTYEPETIPKGALEFEQWITLGSQRTKGGDVKQQNFNRWEIREELEYGVTDN